MCIYIILHLCADQCGLDIDSFQSHVVVLQKCHLLVLTKTKKLRMTSPESWLYSFWERNGTKLDKKYRQFWHLPIIHEHIKQRVLQKLTNVRITFTWPKYDNLSRKKNLKNLISIEHMPETKTCFLEGDLHLIQSLKKLFSP